MFGSDREETPPAVSVSDGRDVKCVRELMRGSVHAHMVASSGKQPLLVLREIAFRGSLIRVEPRIIPSLAIEAGFLYVRRNLWD